MDTVRRLKKNQTRKRRIKASLDLIKKRKIKLISTERDDKNHLMSWVYKEEGYPPIDKEELMYYVYSKFPALQKLLGKKRKKLFYVI